jgi:radical SAM superfamily enzyme YgiQ (UPF0313 family)
MNIALVFPPFYLPSLYNLPPLGLVNLAAALKETRHLVTILDFVLALRQKNLRMGKQIYDDCAEAVLAEMPDVVGLSAQCTTYPAVLQIARRIKMQKPGVKIVIGGHNASFVDGATLKGYPFVDCIVRSEGERTFAELIAAYNGGGDEEGVLGTTYRRRNEVIRNGDRPLVSRLDDLPMPDYGLAPPLSDYRDACGLSRNIAILEVGRGCPHACAYCSESIFWRRRTRTFSVPRLVDEMGRLHRDFGAECFLLAYDQFTAGRGFAESFCRRVIEAGLNHLAWYCISRLDGVDAELLALMRDAGCESMCYGIDSGSKRTLAFIHKNIDEQVLYRRVKETADAGIVPTLSFVIGFPEEEKADVDDTLRLALRTGIVGNNNPLIQLPTVLPGTELHRGYLARLVRERDTYFALGLEFDGVGRLASDEELIRSSPEIFSSFYNLPCRGRSLEELDLIATYFPLVVRFYPKTFLLLCIELEASPSDLFLRWLRHLAREEKRTSLALSPQECYRRFGGFASAILSEKGELLRRHLPEVLRYETAGLDAARFAGPRGAVSVDPDGAADFRPRRGKGLVVEEFDFDMPVIILALKTGDFNEIYEPRKTLLLFRQERDVLDVSEINPFVRDFLWSCDGVASLASISGSLYGEHGNGMNPEEFFNSCVEAVNILGKSRFLDSEEDDDPQERRKSPW